MIEEVQDLTMEGFWEIVDAYPESKKHRKDKHCVFSYNLKVGNVALWYYPLYNRNHHDLVGKHTQTSTVKRIQIINKQVQVSTQNSQYVFERVI